MHRWEDMRKVFVLLLASLIVMLTMSLMFTSVASADDPPYLKFTIQTAGKNTGTLTLYYANDTVIKSWDAKSGKIGKGPDCEYDRDEGPIPHGNSWKVLKWCSKGTKPGYPLDPWDGASWTCKRNYFKIHQGDTESDGCIIISSSKFEDFNSTFKKHWPPDATSIDLTVSYPDNAYDCSPKPKCCDKVGMPNRHKKGYCPENPEKGCCQYGEECYDNNGNEWYRDECEKCYEGEWHSGNACCPSGSPGGTCYNISNPEDGCCQYKVNNEDKCYDDIHPPDKCDKCYGGSWKPGWHCEEGECVPEASTLVLFATGLLFLAGYLGFRRKEN